MEKIYDFDFALLDALQEIHCTALDLLFAFFTYIGVAGAVWVIAALVAAKSGKTRPAGLAVILALAYDAVINEMIIKHIFERPRPFTLHPWIDTVVTKPSSFSFPSGHACSSFAAATAIFCYNKKYGVFAYLIAACIAFSRNYFYIHYPTDVICGSLSGLLLGVLGYLTAKKLYPVLAKRFTRADREV